jgi:acyl-CoA synthetase (AMP-forming)/AMP-acid ligase II
MYLIQGLRRPGQIRPHGLSTVFRDRRRTWAETVERVTRFAGGLRTAGVQPGDRVGILALNSDHYYELLYAIPWLGAVMVPINTRLAVPEIAYILEDSVAHCHTQIAGYKCPRSVEFRDTPLPLSGAGKILKRELREPFWRGYERRVN